MSDNDTTPKITTKVVGDDLVATLPGRKTIKVSLVLDLDALFDLMDGVAEVEDAGQISDIAALRKLRHVIPATFHDAVKGIDMTLAFALFKEWMAEVGRRSGEALS